MKALPLCLLLAACNISWGRDRVPPEPTVRLCLQQREIILRRETVRVVELQPCVPAIGEFR